MTALPPLVAALRQRRQKLGWTQNDLAYHLQISVRRFRALELGERKPTAEHLLSWAGHLGFSVDLKENEQEDPMGPSVGFVNDL